jgi:hypothetical protein
MIAMMSSVTVRLLFKKVDNTVGKILNGRGRKEDFADPIFRGFTKMLEPGIQFAGRTINSQDHKTPPKEDYPVGQSTLTSEM